MLPIVTGDEVIRALERAGFVASRKGKGSHQPMVRRVEGETTRMAVVKRGGDDIPRGTMASILRQAGLSEDEFRDLL